MIQLIYPKKILKANLVENEKNLLVKKPLQIGLNEPLFTTVEEGGYLIVDFGKELCGSVRILTFLADNLPVRIRFGESLTECCSEIGEKNSTNDHSLRDIKTTLPSYSDMTFANTGFRFLRIDCEGVVKIKSIIAINNIFNKKAVYNYKGEDKLVSKIYSTAKRTVDLCSSSGYLWDGVKRDRLVWIGDIHPEMLALTTLYGRLPLIEKSIEFVREQTPLPAWMNNIPTYSLWWIIVVCDYYKRTGAKDFLIKQIDYINGVISMVNANVYDNGDIDFPLLFTDWATHDTPAEIHGVRAIFIIAMKKAIEILKEIGLDYKLASDILERLLKVEISVKKEKQILGLKYFATELTEEDKKSLIEGGAKGMSTFMSYYILKAVASFDKQKAVEMMKEYYGGMLEKGATTFFEDFDIEWMENSSRIDRFPKKGQKDIHGDFGRFCYTGFRHSLCHGWSAGVITFIEEEL